MNLPPELFTATAEHLGWALVHSLWQGAVVAIVLATALHLLRSRSAAARHAACLFALLVLCASTVATLARFEQPASPPSARPT